MGIPIKPQIDVVVQVCGRTINIIFARPPGIEIKQDIDELKNQPGIIFSEAPSFILEIGHGYMAQLGTTRDQLTHDLVYSMTFLPNYDVLMAARAISDHLGVEHNLTCDVFEVQARPPEEEDYEHIAK